MSTKAWDDAFEAIDRMYGLLRGQENVSMALLRRMRPEARGRTIRATQESWRETCRVSPSVEHALFWKLMALETESDFRELLRAGGCWHEGSWKKNRKDAMRFFVVSGGLCDPKRYEAFIAACVRLGEAEVRRIGIEAAIRQEKHRAQGHPPCPDCGSFELKRRRTAGRTEWQCSGCLREFGRKLS